MKHMLKHGAGFVLAGAIAFSTDMTVLWLLTSHGRLDPYSARVIAICAAMVAAYFAHRRFSFQTAEPPSLAQFAKFASIAGFANALNYAIYAGILVFVTGSTPLGALLIASVIAIAVSYTGFRFGVFRAPKP